MRHVPQHGNIDNYLLKTKPELLGWEGMRLRQLIREKKEVGEELVKAAS